MADNRRNANWTFEDWHQTWPTWSDAGPDCMETPDTDQPLLLTQMQYLETLEGKYTNIVFDVSKMLGKGSYGTVWKVTAQRHFTYVGTNTPGTESVTMACKVIRLVYDDTKHFVLNVNQLVLNVLVLQGLDNRHIATLDHYIPIPDRETGFPFTAVLVFMELCDGNLKTMTQDIPGGKMSSEHCRIWFMQMLFALEYLHEHRVAHLDIKPSNILYQFVVEGCKVSDFQDMALLSKTMHSIVFKLSDFGLSIRYGANEPMEVTKSCGTIRYMAHEMVAQMSLPAHMKTPIQAIPCDIYSLGTTLAYAYLGEVEFGNNWHQMIYCMCTPEVLTDSPLLAGVVKWMIKPRPHQRITVEALLKHEWLWSSYESMDS